LRRHSFPYRLPNLMGFGGGRRGYIYPVNLGPRFPPSSCWQVPSHQPLNSELRWASSFQTFCEPQLLIKISVTMSHSARVYQQQPGAINGMVVAPGGGGNRNAMNMPVDADGREWSHGLFGCMSACGTCALILIWHRSFADLSLPEQASARHASLASSTARTSTVTST
jgi:hypothetical protein